jgi:small subunit ribosomal protein S1
MNDEQLVQSADRAETAETAEQQDNSGNDGNSMDMGLTAAADQNGEATELDAGGSMAPQMNEATELDAVGSMAPQMNEATELDAVGSMAPQMNMEADAESSAPGADGTESGGVQVADGAESGGAQAADGAESAESGGAQAADGAQDDMLVRASRDPRLSDMAPNASMEDLLKASEQQYRTLKHGEVIEGTIMRVDRDEILVDIGAKTEGVIPNRESQTLSDEERQALQIGDEVFVSVVQPESTDGHAILSVDRARQEKAWRDLQRQFDGGETIQAQVVGHNKGGLLVNLDGVRGFVPSSQISSMPPGEANKQAELAKMHNQTISLKIIEINRGRNRLILSERQAMQEQRESMRARLLQELEPGQVRPGTVTSICDFGAFVDIGGADGLIHLSELSWKRVAHPREVLQSGQRIDVYVLSVDPTERKIALSLKRTQPEPWETITDTYQLGQVVRGTITQVTSFGAFARLEDGIEGLIHVSELAEGRVANPKSVVNVGETYDLKVIRIDPAKKRIGLSLKRMAEEAPPATEDMGDEAEAATAPDAASMMAGAPTQETPLDTPEAPPSAPSRPSRREDTAPARPAAALSYGDYDTGGDMPMGALAHALAAHSQSRRDQDERAAAAEMSEVSDDAPAADVTAVDATADVESSRYETGTLTEIATDIDAGAYATQSLTDVSDMRTKELSSDIDAISGTGESADAGEGDGAGVGDEPAAMMPSASDIDAAVETTPAMDEDLSGDATSTASTDMLSDAADTDNDTDMVQADGGTTSFDTDAAVDTSPAMDEDLSGDSTDASSTDMLSDAADDTGNDTEMAQADGGTTSADESDADGGDSGDGYDGGGNSDGGGDSGDDYDGGGNSDGGGTSTIGEATDEDLTAVSGSEGMPSIADAANLGEDSGAGALDTDTARNEEGGSS